MYGAPTDLSSKATPDTLKRSGKADAPPPSINQQPISTACHPQLHPSVAHSTFRKDLPTVQEPTAEMIRSQMAATTINHQPEEPTAVPPPSAAPDDEQQPAAITRPTTNTSTTQVETSDQKGGSEIVKRFPNPSNDHAISVV